MDYDTKLIAEVKKYPELYDNTHKNFKNKEVKQALWYNITYNLRKECDDESVRTVRMRWKSLRDSYVKETKHKMALSSGQNVKPRKNWRYSSAMSFLAPYLALSFPITTNFYSDESETKSESMETIFVNLDNFQKSPSEHFLGALLDYSSRNQSVHSPDAQENNEIDSFFKGIADTVKKLSPVHQVKIQRDIVNMVLDFKLKEVQGNNCSEIKLESQSE